MKDVSVVVLAAGKGTRMGKKTPKVLRLLAGKPVIYWTLGLLKRLTFKMVIVVTGYGARLVEEFIRKAGFNVTFVKERKLLGTAHAVKIALKKVPKTSKAVFILFGDDSALYKKETIKKFINYFLKNGKPGVVLVTEKESATTIGGLKRDRRNNLVGVYTKQEIIEAGIAKHEVACGAFVFEKRWLTENIRLVRKNPTSGEYLLPSLIEIAADKKEFIKTYRLPNPNEWQSINTEEELKEAEKKKSILFKNGK